MQQNENLKKILVATDDRTTKISIGKEIKKIKKDIYEDQRSKSLMENMLCSEVPEASREVKEDLLNITIYNYWMYGLNIKESFCLNMFTKKHEEIQKYITYRNRYLYLQHMNDMEYAHPLLTDKYSAYRKLEKYYKRDVIEIKAEEDFEKFDRFTNQHPTFVVKPVALGFGQGIHLETISRANKKEVFAKILNEGLSIKNKYHIATLTTRFVLEEIIEQNDALKKVHSHSINCVRLSTIFIDGHTVFFYPRIKIGRGGNFISNGGANGLLVGIDAESGICNTDAYDEFGNVYEVHPDTGIKFKGLLIPQWDELLALGDDLAKSLQPKVRYVGWDMAYTPHRGWCVIEGNCDGEFVGAQLAYKKGLKLELEKLLDWKPKCEYWWEENIIYPRIN